MNFTCKTCSKGLTDAKTGAESLLMHILEKNHIAYDVVKEAGAVPCPLCCAYCKNPNATILGYCVNLQDYICLDCIGRDNVFKSETDWVNAYSSWSPLILCKEFCMAQKCVPKKYECEKKSSPSNYALWLNASYIHDTQASVPRNRIPKPIICNGTVKGSAKNCCSFECSISRASSFHQVGQCFSVSLNKKDDVRYDAIVIFVSNTKLILAISKVGLSTLSSTCSLVLQPSTMWSPSLALALAAGRLSMNVNIDSTMLTALTTRNAEEVFKTLRVSSYDRVNLKDEERSTMGTGLRRAACVFECGPNDKRQARR